MALLWFRNKRDSDISGEHCKYKIRLWLQDSGFKDSKDFIQENAFNCIHSKLSG